MSIPDGPAGSALVGQSKFVGDTVRGNPYQSKSRSRAELANQPIQQSTALLVAAIALGLPGPTNVLFGLAGARNGFFRAAYLAIAAVAGYGLAVGLLVSMTTPLVAADPSLGRTLRLAAGAVLLQAAIRLWRHSGQATSAASKPVSASQVFLTTLFNPKALVLAVLVRPADAAAHIDRSTAASLSVLILFSALGWIGLGAALNSGMPILASGGWIERGGSIVLLAFAAALATSAIH